ncbi:MAG: hypothetical protein C4523_14450 [Myxococcales bacterium]|nr:MAG: hypothetical protein C4523_14450 [Myxococcales bacterium]
MKPIASILAAAVVVLSAGAARAETPTYYSDYGLGFALTVGEGMYIIDNNVYRAPVSLELVPSLGWTWVKFDLGLYTTLESLDVAGTEVGNWNFTFRPGGRFTPPMIPLYLRAAFPLQIQRYDFDWGVMFGLGVDFHLFLMFGLVLEVDTTLTNQFEWGRDGMPLEFRAGIAVHL